jgi:hypothetical protein
VTIFTPSASTIFFKKSVSYTRAGFVAPKFFYSKIKSLSDYLLFHTFINASFLKDTVKNTTTRFRPKDISNLFFSESMTFFSKKPLFFFLRKSKLFNKGRYSRNRQTYRTGAYWCF